ncbi:MAG: Uma2 family endonuclease [Aphanocapsa sp. GSE-SYN-MK-11-07L]|jgi:Uma2 family endonuclease|nr:Uma2 family endonuclease [Aphanocapsa sp. GSE-SYN-MK-11-07L]
MQSKTYPVPQTDPPLSPRLTLPTMYDLPSENSQEPGLPDEYHSLQPQLLTATLRLADYSADNRFSVGDMNLYYDVRHANWYKRPDWFLVLGVPRLYDQQDSRLSYVIWQEGVSPFIVVELLSPGTEKEDLGKTLAAADSPPTKWQVYEQILRVPYYIVLDRYTNHLRAFGLTTGGYQPLEMIDQRLWLPELAIGLGVWQGEYQGITRSWLRWYDVDNNWTMTDAEQECQAKEQALIQVEQAIERAELAESQLEQVVLRLLQSGMPTAQVADLTGLAEAEVVKLTQVDK